MRRDALAWGAAALLVLAGGAFLAFPASRPASCGAGFVARGGRCFARADCPPPLTTETGECVAVGRVSVPKTRLSVGRVRARIVEAGPVLIDAFEATASLVLGRGAKDGLRAASGLSRPEALAFCMLRGGRLPTEEEWIIAAAGSDGHRYPWGDTGAVCRRAAYGLARGPCFFGGDGPDTVGAHADGDSPGGLHDMAGNVAEWVAPDPRHERVGIAKGGSWRTELAAELRTWARLELDPNAHDDRVGVRCVYDAE